MAAGADMVADDESGIKLKDFYLVGSVLPGLALLPRLPFRLVCEAFARRSDRVTTDHIYERNVCPNQTGGTRIRGRLK